MNTLKTKLGFTFFTTMGTIGFYRGFNNKHKEGSMFNPVLRNPNQLYIDRTITGIFSSMYYLNPICYPFIFYYTIKRTEKRIRNLEITNDDWEW